MSIDIAALYARVGIEHIDNGYSRLHGSVCADYDGRLRFELMPLIVNDPVVSALISPTIEKISLLGFNKPWGVKIGSKFIVITFTSSARKLGVDIMLNYKGTWVQTITCCYPNYYYIDEHLDTPNLLWAATTLRKMYTDLLFALLPQPIAEVIDDEFAFFCRKASPSDPI